MGWREHAACRAQGISVEAFFPPPASKASAADGVRGVCFPCPVRLDCLIAGDGFRGVWGGTTERERRLVLSGRLTLADVDARWRSRTKVPA